MSFWDTITAPFTGKPIQDAAKAQIAAAQQGYAQYGDLANRAAGAVTDYGSKATAPWSDLYTRGLQGYDTYADATGANGPEGLARAKQNFQTSPGFQFQLDTGLDALTRAAAAQGGAGGNTMVDAMKYGTGLAQQDWGNYVGRLQPFMGAATTAGGGLSSAETGIGGALAGIYGNQGQAAMQTQNTIGQAQAQGAMAPYYAGSNILNAGLQIGKMALGLPGGGGGIGGGGSGGGGGSQPWSFSGSPLGQGISTLYQGGRSLFGGLSQPSNPYGYDFQNIG
jgi:hypothetical protein